MSEERIVDTHKLPSEQEFFPALRPERLVEFVGQAKARENLQVFIESKIRSVPNASTFAVYSGT